MRHRKQSFVDEVEQSGRLLGAEIRTADGEGISEVDDLTSTANTG